MGGIPTNAWIFVWDFTRNKRRYSSSIKHVEWGFALCVPIYKSGRSDSRNWSACKLEKLVRSEHKALKRILSYLISIMKTSSQAQLDGTPLFTTVPPFVF